MGQLGGLPSMTGVVSGVTTGITPYGLAWPFEEVQLF